MVLDHGYSRVKSAIVSAMGLLGFDAGDAQSTGVWYFQRQNRRYCPR